MAKSSNTQLSTFKEYSWDNGYFYKFVIEESNSYERPTLESECSFIFGRKNDFLALTDECTDEEIYNLGISRIGQTDKTTIGSPKSCIMVTIEKCLMTMNKGEVSCFALYLPELLKTHRDDYEEFLKRKNTSSEEQAERENCLLFFVLTLEDLSNSKSSCELTHDEKYQLALSHKESGKELFSIDSELAFYRFGVALKYLLAIPIYSEVTLKLSGITKSEKDKYENLKCVCHLNLAACQGLWDNHDGVVYNCDKALSLQPSNVKGLYRRAKAYLALDRPDDARKDLMKLSKLSPKNKDVMNLLNQMKKD